MTLIRLLAIRFVRQRVRPVAVRLLRQELADREAAARKLADEASRGKSGAGSRRGRAWWDGYAHGVGAISETAASDERLDRLAVPRG